MAYYPGHPSDAPTAGRFPQLVESSESIVNDFQVEYATNGTPRIKRRNPNLIREFTIVHMLSKTDKEYMTTFYNTNKDSVFEMYYRATATNYSRCMFSEVPQFEYLVGDYWRVTTKLSQQ